MQKMIFMTILCAFVPQQLPDLNRNLINGENVAVNEGCNDCKLTQVQPRVDDAMSLFFYNI